MTPHKLRISAGLTPLTPSDRPPSGRAILAGTEIVAVVWPTGADRGLSQEQAEAERDQHAKALVAAYNHVYRASERSGT